MEKYDLHAHLFTIWERGMLSFERASREPEVILDAIQTAGLDGIGLADFQDHRFAKLASYVREGQKLGRDGRYKVVKKLRNSLVFATGTGLINIIRVQEVRTQEGDVSFIGLDDNINLPYRHRLEATLDLGRGFGAPIVANHPFGMFGIGRCNLMVYANYLTAFEKGNCNYRNLKPEEILGIEEQTGLNGIDVSDSHNLGDLGNGYIIIRGAVDTRSEDAVIESIRHHLTTGGFKPYTRRKNPVASRLGHLALAFYDCKIRRPLRLIETA
jgi:hypothetical protein